MHPKSIPQLTPSQIESFWSKVEVHHPAGCWIWTGRINRTGYGRFHAGSRMLRAHRFAYDQLIGGLDLERVLHHLCHNKLCCNPDHMALVHPSQHKKLHPTKRRRSQNVCFNGHDMTVTGFFTAATGQRFCKVCSRRRAWARNQEMIVIRQAYPRRTGPKWQPPKPKPDPYRLLISAIFGGIEEPRKDDPSKTDTWITEWRERAFRSLARELLGKPT